MPLHCLHAEGNAAQTEDPAAQQQNDQTQEPLHQARLFSHLSQTSLSTVIALNLERFVMSGGNAVWGHH